MASVRGRPGQLKMSGAGRGAIWHLSGVRWLAANSLSPDSLPWLAAESPRAAADLLVNGNADVIVCSMYEIRSLAAARGMKTIAVMADKRFSRYPDVPTLAEQKQPLQAGIWRGLAGPKGMAGPAIERVTAELRRAYATPSFLSGMTHRGFMPALMDQPAFATFVTAETVANGEAMRAAGVV